MSIQESEYQPLRGDGGDLGWGPDIELELKLASENLPACSALGQADRESGESRGPLSASLPLRLLLGSPGLTLLPTPNPRPHQQANSS